MIMRRNVTIAGLLLCSTGMFAAVASGQQFKPNAAGSNTQMRAYSVARESLLQGTVLKYVAASTKAPFGAHVLLQTASGVVDVHAGSAQYLQSVNLTLAPGDNLKITGEYVAYGDGAVYVARVIQKDGRSVAVRTARGFPLSPVNRQNAGGVL